MRLLRLMTLVALTMVVACDSSDDSDIELGNVPSDLVGTWVATSLMVGNTDFVASGTTFEITFTADNNYQFITADSPGDLFCDGSTSCSSGGLFDVQGDTFIFDADESDAADRTVLNVTTLSAMALVLEGFIDGDEIRFSFVRK